MNRRKSWNFSLSKSSSNENLKGVVMKTNMKTAWNFLLVRPDS